MFDASLLGFGANAVLTAVYFMAFWAAALRNAKPVVSRVLMVTSEEEELPFVAAAA